MKVIFDTKILQQIDRKIDDYYESYKIKNGLTDEVIDRTLGMKTALSWIREAIFRED